MIKPIYDKEIIRGIITHESIWPYVHDDLTPNPEDYQVADPIDEYVYYLGVFDPELVGMFVVHRHNLVTYEIHTCLLKDGRGKAAIRHSWDVLEWIFNNTQCERLITNIPEDNKLAERLALSVGFKEYGINYGSFKVNGQLKSIKLLGISKG